MGQLHGTPPTRHALKNVIACYMSGAKQKASVGTAVTWSRYFTNGGHELFF